MIVPPRPQGARRAVAGRHDRGPGRRGRVLRAQRLGQHGEGRHRLGLPVPVARHRHRGAVQRHRLQAQRHHPGAAVDRHRQHAAGVRRRHRRGDGAGLHGRPGAAVAQLAAVDAWPASTSSSCATSRCCSSCCSGTSACWRPCRRPGKASISSASPSSIAAACRSRRPTTFGLPARPAGDRGPDRRADRAGPLGQDAAGADRPGLPDLDGRLRAVRPPADRRAGRGGRRHELGHADPARLQLPRRLRAGAGVRGAVRRALDLHRGLHRRDRARRHPVGAAGPDRRRPRARAHARPRRAPGRHPAGHAGDHPADHQPVPQPDQELLVRRRHRLSRGGRGVHGLGAGVDRTGDRDHRHHAGDLPDALARGVGADELVQRPPPPGDGRR